MRCFMRAGAVICVVSALGLASLMTGCMKPVSKQDPLNRTNARFEPQNVFPRTSVGIIESENTKEAAKLLSRASMWWCPLAILGQHSFDHKEMIRDYSSDLSRIFKSAVPLQSIDEARTAGVDLVAILDIVPTLPGATGAGVIKMDVGVIFLDAQGNRVAEARGSGTGESPDNKHPTKVLMAAHTDARRSLQAALASNRELLAMAGMDVPPAPVAAAQTGARPEPPKRTFSSDVEKPSYASRENPDRFALIIGVEKYADLPAADYASRDAESVRTHLLALGFPQRNIILLTGQGATRTGMEKYVESWLPRNVKENSRVFFYFSGHGAPDPKTGQAYLVPWDGDPKFIENTGYPITRLYDRLNALKASEIIVALDTCFSGAGGRSVLAKGMRPLVVTAAAGPSGSKLTVLAAAGPDEVTGTEEGAGHGLFTYYFLKGLNAKGGKSSARELYEYLLPQVQDAARRDNRDQTPMLFGAKASEARLE